MEQGKSWRIPAGISKTYLLLLIASQNNFNACVENKDPGQSLLILGRGGYAAAGISEDSAYYKGAMSIIRSYHLTDYDKFAINHWQAVSATHTQVKGKGNAKVLDNYVGQQVGNGNVMHCRPCIQN